MPRLLTKIDNTSFPTGRKANALGFDGDTLSLFNYMLHNVYMFTPMQEKRLVTRETPKRFTSLLTQIMEILNEDFFSHKYYINRPEEEEIMNVITNEHPVLARGPVGVGKSCIMLYVNKTINEQSIPSPESDEISENTKSLYFDLDALDQSHSFKSPDFTSEKIKEILLTDIYNYLFGKSLRTMRRMSIEYLTQASMCSGKRLRRHSIHGSTRDQLKAPPLKGLTMLMT